MLMRVVTRIACDLQSVIMLSLPGAPVWPCDFEEGFCQWFQLSDGDFNWTRYQGNTASQNTGPDADHTKGTSELLGKININSQNGGIFHTFAKLQYSEPFDIVNTVI